MSARAALTYPGLRIRGITWCFAEKWIMHVCVCKRLPRWINVRISIKSSFTWRQGTESVPSAIAPDITGKKRRMPQPIAGTCYDVGLRAHHAAKYFSLLNVKNTAQSQSDIRVIDCDHMSLGCVRRPSATVFEQAIHGLLNRECAPTTCGAQETTRVGWIQSLQYPSLMVIGQ